MMMMMMVMVMMMMVMMMINSGCWYCHKNGFSDSSEWFRGLIIYDRHWWYLASSAHGANVMMVLWWLLMCVMQWSGDFTLGCKGPSTIQPQSMNPANSNAVQKKKRNTLGVAAFKVTNKVCEMNGTRFSADSLSNMIRLWKQAFLVPLSQDHMCAKPHPILVYWLRTYEFFRCFPGILISLDIVLLDLLPLLFAPVCFKGSYNKN